MSLCRNGRIYQSPIINVMWHQWWYKLIRCRQLYYLPQNTVVLNDRPNTHWTSSLRSVFVKIELKFAHFYCLILFWCKQALIINKQASAAAAEGRLRRRAYQARLGNQESTWLAAEELQTCDATVYLYLRGPHRTARGIINTSCKQHISHGNNHVMSGGILWGVHRVQEEWLDRVFRTGKCVIKNGKLDCFNKNLYTYRYMHLSN